MPPTGWSSIRVTGMMKLVLEVRKASRAPLASSMEKGRSSRATPSASATRSSEMRVMPFRIALFAFRVTSVPSWVTIQALVEVPSVTLPSGSTCQAS